MKKTLLFLVNVIFRFLDGDDKNKHKRILALVLICLLTPPACLFIWGQYQRAQWFRANPHTAFPPAAVK